MYQKIYHAYDKIYLLLYLGVIPVAVCNYGHVAIPPLDRELLS